MKTETSITYDSFIKLSKDNYSMLKGHRKLRRLIKRLRRYNRLDNYLLIFNNNPPEKREIIYLLKSKLFFKFCTIHTLNMACVLLLDMWHKQYNKNFILLDEQELCDLAIEFKYND